MSEIERLRAERDFLRARHHGDLGNSRWVGLSSDAMVEYALGGPLPHAFRYPHDCADLARCLVTRKVAPEHLRPRMSRLLTRYRAKLTPEAIKRAEELANEWLPFVPVKPSVGKEEER